MAIRIRCTGCKKKISMDDAFAGGTCRCPYCKEIVLVGGTPTESTAARPYAPVDRPDTPDEPPPSRESEAAEAAPAGPREVPMANPVRIQGVVTVVLMGLIVVMAACALWLGVMLSRHGADANVPFWGGGVPASPSPSPSPSGGGNVVSPRPSASGTATPAPTGSNPFVSPSEGPNAAGVKIAAPVIYVLDGGGSMKNLFDYARYMTRLSVLSLGMGAKFNIVLCTQDGAKFLSPDYRPGAGPGDAAAKEFLMPDPQGSVDVEKGLELAIAKAPKTIVLLRRSEVGRAKEIADKAKAAGVVIVAVGLGSDSGAKDSLSVLAGATGGQCVTFGEAALANWVDKAPPLE